jgi:uncharacterized protein YqhQ
MPELPDFSDDAPATNGNGAGPNGSTPAGEDAPIRLGGMAMRNGLLVHGPTHWAAAARNANTGAVDVASGPKPNFGGNLVAKVPLLRGPVRMAEAFAVIPIARKNLPSARLPFEDPRVIAAGIGVTLASNLLRRKNGGSVGGEALSSALGMVPAVVALSGSELASYHGVEHKAIAAYEHGSRDPRTAAKEHQRCGSNLIGPMMVFTIAGQAIMDRLPNAPGPIARGFASVASLSLAVETFAYAEKNPDSPVGRSIHAAGDGIQRLFATREPNEDQIEVGIAAMDAILAAEGVEDA